ncbi:MAG: N-methyl-L-tryptophan oxidase [Caulobacteraceae bacterium]
MGSFDVAVVGLGAMGAASLHALSRRGARVVGCDRFEPGHDRGSSHGESRIIRLAYFEDPAYVPLVRLAYEAWERLQADTGRRIMIRTGMLEAGVKGSALVEGSLRSANEHGIAHELLSPAQVAERFPAFSLPHDWDCLFQADGGLLEPEKAIRLLVETASAQGATVHANARVRRVAPKGEGVAVELEDGTVVEAGSAIVAAGPWMGELVPELAPHLTLTRQTLTWFEPVDPALVGPDRMPAFLIDTVGGGAAGEAAGDALIYGLPDIGAGVKAGSHLSQGVLAGPDAPRPAASPAETAALRELLGRYIPAAAGPPRHSRACTYTRTPDEHFVLGPHPDAPQIVLASPCSGHGFKFASIIGEILADLVLTGATPHPIGLFSPGRLMR